MIRNDTLRVALAAAIALTLAGGGACAQPPASTAGAASAPVPADVDSVLPRADRGRTKGADGAPLTLIEVSDFQCPYCRQWTETTYRQLDSAYIRTGKVKMVFINYPLPNHPRAYAASEAAMCAGAQGKFWPMHDRLFATQREWSGMADAARRFDAYAGEIGLDMAAFRDCTANDRVAQLIIGDALKAAGGGINGTPTFVINGTRLLGGAVTFEQMKTELDAALAGAPPSN
ncbi:MAG TPA: thioredoxin domain-containing protein [Longimicrobium sp.]|nr:thioredoxin domain-containing protein [Longimicrobium sp.]